MVSILYKICSCDNHTINGLGCWYFLGDHFQQVISYIRTTKLVWDGNPDSYN